MSKTITIDLSQIARALLEPYEAFLDCLMRDGRISQAERDQLQHDVQASRARYESDPVDVPLLLPDRYRSD